MFGVELSGVEELLPFLLQRVESSSGLVRGNVGQRREFGDRGHGRAVFVPHWIAELVIQKSLVIVISVAGVVFVLFGIAIINCGKF